MRLHTNTHTHTTIHEALDRAKANDLIAQHVYLETCTEHGSRKKNRAFEISLRSYDKVEGDGRRRPNQNTGERELWAATYDEWGWFIAELFDVEPDAIFGHYIGQAGFDDLTHGAYPLTGDSLIPA